MTLGRRLCKKRFLRLTLAARMHAQRCRMNALLLKKLQGADAAIARKVRGRAVLLQQDNCNRREDPHQVSKASVLRNGPPAVAVVAPRCLGTRCSIAQLAKHKYIISSTLLLLPNSASTTKFKLDLTFARKLHGAFHAPRLHGVSL